MRIAIFEEITQHDSTTGKLHYIHNGIEFSVDAAKLVPRTISVDGAEPFDSLGTSCPNGMGNWPLCNRPFGA